MTVPDPVAYASDLMSNFPGRWALCGGWAIDAWLGRPTRDHHDVDIAFFHDDQRIVHDYFAGWALVAHDPNVPGDTKEPWNGRHVDLPAHIHVPRRGTALSTSGTAIHAEHELELVLAEREAGAWILNREPRVSLPLSRAIQWSRWGLPTAAPELVLFYKAGGSFAMEDWEVMRSHDERDFHAIRSTLADDQREWLRAALAQTRRDHSWLAHLGPAE